MAGVDLLEADGGVRVAGVSVGTLISSALALRSMPRTS
jgi:hypothetical protein